MRLRRSLNRSLSSVLFLLVCVPGFTGSSDVEQDSGPAAALWPALERHETDTPDGGSIRIGMILTPERLETCLETVEEAEAWPVAWLVVQEASMPFDLILRLTMSQEENAISHGPVFTAPRQEWDTASLRKVIRDATGRKPKGRSFRPVIQGFSTRIVTTWVYRDTATVEAGEGLIGLLPEGAVLREARSVALRDGGRHTLALVLLSPRFVPADCTGCAGRSFGHSDSGQVRIVLAGEREIEDRLDITPYLSGHDGRPLLPRFACESGDPASEPDDETVRSWFAERSPVRLLEFVDLDGDGRPLEIVLPAAYIDCDRVSELYVGIDPETGKLGILD